MGADVVVTDAEGRVVIFSALGSEAWTLVASPGARPAWKPIRIDETLAGAADEGWMTDPRAVAGSEAGSTAIITDRRGRVLLIPSFEEPLILVRDSSGGPVFRHIEAKSDPAGEKDAPWLTSPRAVMPIQKKTSDPEPDPGDRERED